MKKERTVGRGRKRKASKGRVIRVSDLVFKTLNEQRGKGKRSWDEALRRQIGLPPRAQERDWLASGCPPLRIEGWVEMHSQKFFLKEAEARGTAVVEMAKRKTKKFSAPMRVREVV